MRAFYSHFSALRRPTSGCSACQRLFSRSYYARPPRVAPFVLFAAGTSASFFGLAVWWTSYDTKKRLEQVRSSSGLPSIFRAHNPSNETLAGARFQERIERARQLMRAFPRDWHLPTVAAEWYASKSEAQLASIGLIASFIPAFAIWQIPSARGFAKRYLWHDPLASRPVTLLTSVFSHRSLMHIGFNSIALYSIGSMTHTWLTRSSSIESSARRSTSTPELLAFFATAGLASSLASHLFSVRLLVPRMLSGATGARQVLPSLGASGAVYACLAVCALGFPQLSVSLIFLPFFSIPIGAGFAGMVAFDVMGVVRGWQVFDHVAHLAGAMSGMAYYYFGHSAFDRALETISLSSEKGTTRQNVVTGR